MARTISGVSNGALAFSLMDTDWTLSMNPPNLAYGAAYRLESGSLDLEAAGGSFTMVLDAPSLVLLPGSFMERTLELPDVELGPSQFVVTLGQQSLQFPFLPSLSLSGNAVLSAAGFSMSNLTTASASYGSAPRFDRTSTPALLTIGGSSAGNSLAFSSNTLTLVASNPSATILGVNIGAGSLGAVSFSLGLNGGGSASFSLNSDQSLFGGGIVRLKAGTYTLTGANLNTLLPSFAFSGTGRIRLVYPNPSDLLETLVHQQDFALNLAPGADFTASLSGIQLPNFNLGWLRVEPGADGRLHIRREASDGAFSAEFPDWDIHLFGIKFNNQDFTFAPAGQLSRSLPSTDFDFGTGINVLRLDSNGALPFSWNMVSGAVALEFPNDAAIKFPFLPGLEGTLLQGVDLLDSFPILDATGSFNFSWNRTITINGVSFGSQTVTFKRTSATGPMTFSAAGENVLGLPGLDLSISAAAGQNTSSFSAELTGDFALGGYSFGSTNLKLNSLDPVLPFRGSAAIDGPAGLDPSVNVGLGPTSIEFNFFGFPVKLSLP